MARSRAQRLWGKGDLHQTLLSPRHQKAGSDMLKLRGGPHCLAEQVGHFTAILICYNAVRKFKNHFGTIERQLPK